MLTRTTATGSTSWILRSVPLVSLTVFLLATSFLAAQEEREREREEVARRERQERKDPRRLEEILAGLKHGIRSLRALERHEEAEHLEQIAREVAAEMGGRRARRGEGDEGERRRRLTERERILPILDIAVHALAESGHGEAAERLMQAARALQLEGVESDEAHEARRRAPGNEELVRILSMAAEILGDQGRKDQAAAVNGLARRVRGERERPDAARARRAEPDREGDRPRRREEDRDRAREREIDREREPDRERRRERDERLEQVHQLRAELEQMRRVMEEMQERLEHLSREKD